MGAKLVLITLIATAFTLAFYRGLYLRWARMRRYKNYAETIHSAVKQHFSELKAKSESLIIDKGYGIIDKSAWADELHTFVSSVIFSKLGLSKQGPIRTNPARSCEFTTFSVNYIGDLLCYATCPETIDYQNTINSIEDLARVDSFMMGTPAFIPSRVLIYKFSVALFAACTFSPDYSIAANGEAFAPFEACNVLADQDGFVPSNYTELYEEVYSCGTKYKDLGVQPLPNNLSLYAKGNPKQATLVRLMLNVNITQNAPKDAKVMAGFCEQIVIGLTGSPVPSLVSDISAIKPFSVLHEGYKVAFTKTQWKTGKGYELNCSIATKDHKE